MASLIKAMGLILQVATSLEQARLLWSAHEAQLQEIIKEGRDPSEDEWFEILNSVRKKSQELQS